MIKKIRQFLIIVIVSYILALCLQWVGLFQFLELRAFDVRSKWAQSNVTTHPDIVIVLIDDNSINSLNDLLGRWPWPRYVYAEYIEFFHSLGAKVQVFDILFTEAQKDRLKSSVITDDMLFTRATIESGTVIHGMQLAIDKLSDSSQKELLLSSIPPSVIKSVALPFKTSKAKNATDVFLPYSDLIKTSPRLGFVDIESDSDGINRRVDLIRAYNNNIYPSLPLATALFLLDPTHIKLTEKPYLSIDSTSVPLASNLTYLVKMKQNFETYSAGAVLQTIQALHQGRIEDMIIDPEVFENKIIFFGASAAGTYDRLTLSLGPNIPGVFFQASVLDNILLKDFYSVIPPWINGLIGFFILFLTGSSILFLSNLKNQLFFVFTIALSFIGFNLINFNYFSIIYNLVFPLGCYFIILIHSYGYLALTEGAEKRRMKKMLSKYVSPNVLSEIINKPKGSLIPEVGEKEEMTIFFSDIRGFTSISEKTSAENIVLILNHYLTRMVDIVFSHSGTLDKFIGDAVMAFWGAPLKTKTHAFDAVCTALDMKTAKKSLDQQFEEKNWPTINFGIGIHTGPVVVGNIGSPHHLEYTIIGDNVNLASRIEGLTKYYHAIILISEDTFKQLDEKILCRKLDCVQVKGKSTSITLYEPLCLTADTTSASNDIITYTNKGFDHYKSQDWDLAISTYKKVQKLIPNDFISQLMIDRCIQYKTSPPTSDWKGVHIFDTK